MEKKTEYSRSLADKFFASFPQDKVIKYKEYWDSVQPQNTSDNFGATSLLTALFTQLGKAIVLAITLLITLMNGLMTSKS